MKKIDSLLKKVELFEKLALCSDRKSFLEALTKESTDSSNNPNKTDKK